MRISFVAGVLAFAVMATGLTGCPAPPPAPSGGAAVFGEPELVVLEDGRTAVQVTASGVQQLRMVARVLFDEPVVVAMESLGAQRYLAVLPPAPDGALVRYSFLAVLPGVAGEVSHPPPAPGRTAFSFVAGRPTDPTRQLPTLRWFIDDLSYDDLVDDPSGEDRTEFPAVVAFGDQVIEGVTVRLKGESTRAFRKRSYKFVLPPGTAIPVQAGATALGEFHLNAEPTSAAMYNTTLAWNLFEWAGVPTPSRALVALERNGAFEGTYFLVDKYSDSWSADHPGEQADLVHEDYHEVVEPDGGGTAAIDAWSSSLRTAEGAERRRAVLDTVDVSSLINVLAVQAVVRNADWALDSNLFSRRHARTGRWSFVPWDLDQALTRITPISSRMVLFGDPDFLSHPRPAFYDEASWLLVDVVMSDPVLQSMYLRRVRTLVDEVLRPGLLVEWLDRTAASARELSELDFERWGTDRWDRVVAPAFEALYARSITSVAPSLEQISGPEMTMAFVDALLEQIRQDFGVDASLSDLGIAEGEVLQHPAELISPRVEVAQLRLGLLEYPQRLLVGELGGQLLPVEQPDDAEVHLDAVGRSATGSIEWIRLRNPSDAAVDVSGWTVPELGLRIPGGTVVASQADTVVATATTADHASGTHLVHAASTSSAAELLSLLRRDGSLASVHAPAP